MAKPFLYRTNKKWLHVAKGNKSAKIRRYLPEYEEKKFSFPNERQQFEKCLANGERFSMGRVAAMTADVLDFSADKVPYDDHERWQQILTRLHEMRSAHPEATTQCRPQPIPQTRLRRFYQTLRLLAGTSVQKAIADYLCKDEMLVDKIQTMFQESVEHFGRYQNREQSFHPRQNPDWFEKYLGQSNKFARCLVARLGPKRGEACHKVMCGSNELAQVRAVDYEISPFRTTGNATFEDGKAGSASGGGGLDILLKDCESGLPIIGEIKARTDVNLFAALIQGLTYAVELTTLAQIQRLKHAYKNDFDKDFDHCDIFLIHEFGHEPDLKKQTCEFAKRLIRSKESAVGSTVRRIVIVEAKLVGADGVKLNACLCAPDRR